MDPTFKSNPDEEGLAADLRDAFGLEEGATGFEVDLAVPKPHAGSSMAYGGFDATAGSDVGTRLGDFEILSELGRGGMGVVYRARQLSLNREVALKVLPGYAKRGRLAIQRFRTEAQAAARLHHTNIVPIYAQGEDRGRFYYAMELIDGCSLDAAIRCRTRLLSPSNPSLSATPSAGSGDETVILDRADGSVGDAVLASTGEGQPRALRRARSDFVYLARLLADVADGLEHAHRHGVIHRDIKPQNLLVGQDERLHITDFGLARLADGPGVTMTGEVMGTPAYLSPEQVTADQKAIDFRTDIYSLGVTLYELLTLRRPFEGETRDQVLSGIRTVQPPQPRTFDSQIPRELQTICLKAMEKDPAWRYASAGAMAEDLRRFADGRPILSRPPGLLVRAAKWARRHKAATSALVAMAIVMVLGAGLTMSVRHGRLERAESLIADVRTRLLYTDYRATDRAGEQLDEAERLGAPWRDVTLLRSLSAMFDRHDAGARDRAVADAEALVDADGDDAEALYLLAIAYDRRSRSTGNEDLQADAATLVARADALPPTAAAMFLRGLALHWNHPDEAIASHEQARQMRAAEGEVFLQATLQVARARNQRMYATRELRDLDAIETALQQLVAFEVYGSFPHYLLSRTHCLAAEIYRGSAGTRADDGLVAMHDDASLTAARAGQAVEPDNPSPVSAEAMCLESRGDFQAALDAHSRSIALAADDGGAPSDYRERYCEALHYRWRLSYWTGSYASALEDIDAHLSCVPGDDIFYAHLYPALVIAESGELEAAREAVLAIAVERPESAYHAIWAATGLRLLGLAEKAHALLDDAADAVDFSIPAAPYQTEEWMRGLYDLARGTRSEQSLNEWAEDSDQPWRLTGEAAFHAAMLALSRGDRDAARMGFLRAYRSYDSEMRYTYHGKLLWVKMEQDERWPQWIPNSGLDLGTSDSVKPEVSRGSSP